MNLILIATCEGKQCTKTYESFMIVRMTGQCTICGHNEISDCAHSIGLDSSKLKEYLFK